MPFRMDVLVRCLQRRFVNRLDPALFLVVCLSISSLSYAQAAERAEFSPEPTRLPTGKLEPAPPTYLGKAFVMGPGGKLVARRLAASRPTIQTSSPITPILDTYVQDGSETAVAINPGDPTNAVVLFNEGWDFNPDIPVGQQASKTTTWAPRTFPNGTGIYTGYPHNPWVVGGNQPGDFYASMVRSDLLPSDNAHTVVGYSTDDGGTFTPFYEVDLSVLQDRPMFDIDRTAGLGGTTGQFDGHIYLCLDDWGSGGSGFTYSCLYDVNSAGAMVDTIRCSGGGAFRGNQFQPVAGTNDGQLFLVSTIRSAGGAMVSAVFHEYTGAGLNREMSKSTLSWAPAGQKLGGSTHYGVNGHRIDEHGTLAVDRTFGPRRGYLYYVSNRNPNPSDVTKDQGDVYLSISFTRASTWQTARIPLPAGHTQYFPMLDVDAQGWLHLAYYQNESGVFDNGILNASRADVYYTVSRDGGQTWAPPTRVNQEANHLELEDPPSELGAFDYYLLGDYMQIRGVGTGTNSAGHVLWTGYDKFRADDGVGTKKERVYATRAMSPAVPAAGSGLLVGLVSLLALSGAYAAFRARRSTG